MLEKPGTPRDSRCKTSKTPKTAAVFVIGRRLGVSSSPLPITKTDAVYGVLNILLRLSIGVLCFSSTVRKSLHYKLVPIAPIFVINYGYSLRGVNLTTLRPLENLSDPKRVHQNSAMGRIFSSIILPINCKVLVVKSVLKHVVHFFNAQCVDLGCN